MPKTTITLSKTEQTSSYSPLTITVTEEHDKLLDEETKAKRIAKMGKQLTESMNKEKKRWKASDEE